jgi:hypothetical protein
VTDRSAVLTTDGSSALAPPPVPPVRAAALRVVRDSDATSRPGQYVPAPPVGLLLRGLLEVLSGWRSAGQLALRMSPEIATDLLARPRRRATRPPQVERLRVLRVSENAVEACAVLRRGERCGALAMRLEHGQRGWLVTRLQVG